MGMGNSGDMGALALIPGLGSVALGLQVLAGWKGREKRPSVGIVLYVQSLRRAHFSAHDVHRISNAVSTLFPTKD